MIDGDTKVIYISTLTYNSQFLTSNFEQIFYIILLDLKKNRKFPYESQHPKDPRGNIQDISWHTLSETPSRGGQIPEMIKVCDYDILIVLGELNTLI